MNHLFIRTILDLYPWAAIVLCAYAIILGGVALFGLVINLFKTVFGHDDFRFSYWAKVAIAAAVACAYYFLYGYKGFNYNFFIYDEPKSAILFIVWLFLPISLLTGSDYFLLSEKAREKK
ncbi:MAG TPA: hypothetical protein VN963_00860 [bacterium]|nr:hypothetical protein [bacterium]